MIRCYNCGTENTDEAKFCSLCGTKIVSEAEAQLILEQREKQKQEEIKLRYEHNLKKMGDRSLIFAILGIILDFIFGIGVIFSLIGFIMGLRVYMKLKSQNYLWPVFLGSLGFIFGVLYLFLLVIN